MITRPKRERKGKPSKLPELSEKIEAVNYQHHLAERAARTAVEHAMECGRLLTEVKAQLRHGEFQPWIAVNFEGSRRTAQAYMRLHKHRDQIEQNGSKPALLSIDEATKLIGDPWIDLPAGHRDNDRMRVSEAMQIIDQVIDCGAPVWFEHSQWMMPHNLEGVDPVAKFLCEELTEPLCTDLQKHVGKALDEYTTDRLGSLPAYCDWAGQRRA